MLIKTLILENFKGIYEHYRIDLKPITLLFGPNSAGKSTILQALVYAREILERHNLDPDRTLLGGEWMDLGGFESLCHKHDKDYPMVIGFELDVHDIDLPNYLHEGDNWLLDSIEKGKYRPEEWLSRIDSIEFHMTIRWSHLLERPLVSEILVEANGERLAQVITSKDAKDISINFVNLNHPVFRDDGDNGTDQISNWFATLLEEALHPQYIRNEVERTPRPKEQLTEFLNDPWCYSLNDSDLSIIDLPIGEQKDALPMRGKGLTLDRSIWGDGHGTYAAQPMVFQLLITSVLSGLIAGSIDLVRHELEKLVYIGPLREVPTRHLTYRRSPEISRWARGSAAWDILHSADEYFLDKVNDWLAGEEKLNSGYKIIQHQYRKLPTDHLVTVAIERGTILDEENLSEILQSLPVHNSIAIRETKTDLEVYPQDIGVGISQVVPIVVGALAQRSGILAIEQPELHIHPALQVALGDLFASQLPDQDALYLVETHSEHLMLRMLRRIRETTDNELPPGAPSLEAEQIAVYFVENPGDGVSMTRIRIDDDGEFLDRWPRGFFGERRKELM